LESIAVRISQHKPFLYFIKLPLNVFISDDKTGGVRLLHPLPAKRLPTLYFE